MGAEHVLTKGLHNTGTEMSLNVLAYNLKGVMNILGVEELLKALHALFIVAIFWLQGFLISEGRLRLTYRGRSNRLASQPAPHFCFFLFISLMSFAHSSIKGFATHCCRFPSSMHAVRMPTEPVVQMVIFRRTI